MSDQARLVVELRELIAAKEVLLVVGAGVSVAATRGAPTASWRGLLLSGVKWCEEMKPALSGRWADRRRDDIEGGTAEEMIAAAELITNQLNSLAPGEYAKWLEEKVGSLRVKEPSVLQALIALDLPFATTNYDFLIEQAAELPAVSWMESGQVEKILRGREAGVLHLHGRWDQPGSVVLGLKSYEAVKNDPHAQAVLRSLRLTKSLCFVGCGEGLSDPNFGPLLTWTRSVFAESTFHQYCLVREAERAELEAQHPLTERIVFLSYGKRFTDLAPFLRRLAPKRAKSAASRQARAKPRGAATVNLPVAVRAYQQRLAEETRLLRMIGLGENLQIDLEIKEAYVPLRMVVARWLTGRHPGRFSPAELKQASHTEENLRLGEMFTVARRYQKRGLILLGEPGAGKTTGARQLCWRLASGQQSPADLGLPPGLVPVLLHLRNLRDGEVETGFQEFVLRETHNADAPSHEAHPGPELWNGSPRLWVFDGLDEVVSEPVRIVVSRRLQEFLDHRRRDWVLVTSRYQGYGEKVDLGPGFIQFHVQPLQPDQVQVFVDRWFAAAYRELYGQQPKAATEARADAGNLKRILGQPEYTIGGLRELRTNPLLLTVVCLVYHQEHALPRGRAALYDKCVTVLLESWRKGLYEQKQAQPFEADAARRVLAQLAWWMHCQSENQAGPQPDDDGRRGSPPAALADMAKALVKPLAETAARAGLGRDGRRFLERMRDESGILVTARPEHCSFLHLTFQEYLAARHAVEEELAAELVARLGQSWWREVILLALARASRPFARKFFTAFLDAPDWDADLAFAARCLDEAALIIFDPFLAKLRSRNKADNPLKVRILRLLRQRGDPALEAQCRKLAADPDPQIAAAAFEILKRTKVPAELGVVAAARPVAVELTQRGEVYIDPRTGMAFVSVPGGEFGMGSKDLAGAQPIHTVRLSPFRLGRYLVTNQEYGRFLAATKSELLPARWDDKNFNQAQQPVVGVSWTEAQSFCQWAGCRLPTEAEWEYACRAGNQGNFCFGDDESKLGDYAWYDANSGNTTQPVGQKKPNDWGLHDMHGNVLEWCQDWYGRYPTRPATDPTGPKGGRRRVLRGGAWDDPAWYCRSACRYASPPSRRGIYFGFRVVLASRSVP